MTRKCKHGHVVGNNRTCTRCDIGEPDSDPTAFTPNMRDIEKNPYTPDEARVAKYLWDMTDGAIGAGDDPIGFLMASHASLSHMVSGHPGVVTMLSLPMGEGDEDSRKKEAVTPLCKVGKCGKCSEA